MPRQQQGLVFRHEEYPLSRWKNGAGETREVARFPQAGEFNWRVSMATVSAAAEFSSFPGIQRWLGVAAGGALAVTVGAVEQEIGIGGEPLQFRVSSADADPFVTIGRGCAGSACLRRSARRDRGASTRRRRQWSDGR